MIFYVGMCEFGNPGATIGPCFDAETLGEGEQPAIEVSNGRIDIHCK